MLSRLIITITCLACVATMTRGFTFVSPSSRRSRVVVQSKHWLDAIDEMCVENAADYCLHEECDVETKLALINQLQDQRDLMAEKVQELDTIIENLRTSNVLVTEEQKAHLDKLMKSAEGTLHM